MTVAPFAFEPAVFVSNAEGEVDGFVGPLEVLANNKQFFKLTRTYNLSRLFCAGCAGASNKTHVHNLISKTNVIEQIVEARDNLFAKEMLKLGVTITPQTRIRSKAQKAKLLQIPEIGTVVARGHGQIPDKEIKVGCTMRGSPLMVECTAENIAFIAAVVKSQIEAGGVASKRKVVGKDDREELDVPGASTLYGARKYRCKVRHKDGSTTTHVESWDKVGKGEAKERIRAWSQTHLSDFFSDPADSSHHPANEADEAYERDEADEAYENDEAEESYEGDEAEIAHLPIDHTDGLDID